MTREEAIDIIKCLAWHRRPPEEEVEMAIKALDQEPCEDCISREAVTEKYKSCADMLSDEELEGVNLVMNWINENPQPKTGHWIKISPAGIYECSECGQNIMTSDICAYKFCHGCGAKMVEPQKREGEE